jgi:hypothetical protein
MRTLKEEYPTSGGVGGALRWRCSLVSDELKKFVIRCIDTSALSKNALFGLGLDIIAYDQPKPPKVSKRKFLGMVEGGIDNGDTGSFEQSSDHRR